MGNINFINGLNGNNNILNPQLDKNNEKKEINYLNLGNDRNDFLNLDNIQGDDVKKMEKNIKKN